ncbi:MAG: aspartate carbamoyltransferase regulatory subunit [Kiritimatiellae bacterium]|nr:aspartate carbamoyltransferase regulatory subunit [Kiritimatiellia bacterium]
MQRTSSPLFIAKIASGLVIDHLTPGTGVELLRVLHRQPELSDIPMTLGVGYPSTRMGRKDLLKIQCDALPPRLMPLLSLLSPGATVKRIRDYVTQDRVVVTAPDLLEHVARCPNPVCITNAEPGLETRFRRLPGDGPARYRCHYCERIALLSELTPAAGA